MCNVRGDLRGSFEVPPWGGGAVAEAVKSLFSCQLRRGSLEWDGCATAPASCPVVQLQITCSLWVRILVHPDGNIVKDCDKHDLLFANFCHIIKPTVSRQSLQNRSLTVFWASSATGMSLQPVSFLSVYFILPPISWRLTRRIQQIYPTLRNHLDILALTALFE
jgi:hypothetical protein